MKYRAVVVAAVLMVAALANIVAPPRACACSCVPQGATEDEVRGADAVFVGVPTKQATRGESVVYQFDVRTVYAGNVGATTTLSTSADTCGVSFDLGEETLVFARRSDSGSGAPYDAGLCTQVAAHRDDVDAVIQRVYGEPHPPDPGAPTASLPGPGASVARVVGIAAGVIVLGAVAAAGLVVWRRRGAA